MRNNRLYNYAIFGFTGIFIILAGLGFYALNARNVVETNILALLPDNQKNELIRYVDDKISRSFEKKLVVLIKHNNDEIAAQAAANMREKLGSNDLFSSSEFQINAQSLGHILDFYKRHSASALSEKQKQWLAQDNFQAIRGNILSGIYGMGGNLGLLEPQQDPLFFFSSAIAELMPDQAQETKLIADIHVIQRNGDSFIALHVQLAQNPFSLQYQQQVINELDRLEAEIETAYPELEIFRSGLIFHAANGADTAKTEMSTMGTLSIIGVFLLLLITFKSVRPFFFVMISILGGGMAGFSICLLFFEKVHILTLVFGTSLVGISIDYALHFLAERYNAEAWDSQKALKTIFPGITLGLITSIIGFLGLCLTPIPVLQQMAIFSIGGLIFVYGCVIFYYPALFKNIRKDPFMPLNKAIAQWLGFCRAIHRPYFKTIFLMAALVLAIAIPFLPGKDDIRAMQTLSPALLNNDQTVAALLGAPVAGQMFVVTGKDDEDMLRNMEEMTTALETLKQDGDLSDYTAISNFASSKKTQLENIDLVQNFVSQHTAELEKLFIDAGFKRGLMDQYLAQLSVQKNDLYALEDLVIQIGQTDIQNLYSRSFDDETLGFILLNHQGDIAAFQALAAHNDNVLFLDKVKSLSDSLNNYRYWAGIFAIGAYVIIFMILMVRYGRSQGITIALPCLLSAGLTLGVITMMNGSYSLFHVLSLLMVMGIGIDYAVFITESAKDPEKSHVQRAFIAIFLSAVTTLLSFGLLATSATSALHDFGLATILGITSTFLLSSVLLFERKNKDAPL